MLCSLHPCLVLVQPRKTRPNITERLLTRTLSIKSNEQASPTTGTLSITGLQIFKKKTRYSVYIIKKDKYLSLF